MDPQQRDAEIISHYVKSLGKERRAITFRDTPSPAPNPIVVAEFAPPNNEYDWVYATIGVSRKPMPDPNNFAKEGIERRIELILYANQRDDELIQYMLRLGLIPFISNTSLDPGDTVVGNADEGMVKGSSLTEILVTHPIFEPESFTTIHHSDGSHTYMLWAIPIHLSERKYAKENGSRALLKLFNANETDTSDFWRSPVA